MAIEQYIQSLIENAWLKGCISGILVGLAEFFDKDWWMIRTMLILIVLDFIFGVITGYKKDRCLSLKKLRNGFFKLLAYNISVIVVWLAQEIVTRSVGLDLPILSFFAGYQSLTELTSVTRHIDELGIRLPIFVKVIFLRYQKQIEDKVQELNPSNSIPSSDSASNADSISASVTSESSQTKSGQQSLGPDEYSQSK